MPFQGPAITLASGESLVQPSAVAHALAAAAPKPHWAGSSATEQALVCVAQGLLRERYAHP